MQALETTLSSPPSQCPSVASNVVPSSPIFVTLMMEATGSSVTSDLTRGKRRVITEYAILHSCRCENLKSYKALTGWSL
jgi:hypothetical protein